MCDEQTLCESRLTICGRCESAARFPGIDVSEIPLVVGMGGTYELDAYAFLYRANLAFTFGQDDKENGDGAVTVQGLLGGRYFLSSEANNTPYVGGGLTVGYSAIEVDGHSYSGGGLGMNAHVGYALARASTIRLFIELGVDLPFYDQEFDDENVPMGVDESLYAPVIGLSFGAGFAPEPRGITIRHR